MSTRRKYDPNTPIIAPSRHNTSPSRASDEHKVDLAPVWETFDALILAKKRFDVVATQLGLDREQARDRAKLLRATKAVDRELEHADETRKRSDAARREYLRLREFGTPVAIAARESGYPRSSAHALEKRRQVERDAHAARPEHRLTPEARRALADFGYFRRRYFGRVAVPWQEDAAERIVKLLETPEKEYLVVNVPPGTGKPVSEAALVLMADGTRKPLRAVRVGDWVITGQGRAKPVTAVHVQGLLPSVVVTATDGRCTTAAVDHPFLTAEQGYVEAADCGGLTAPPLLRWEQPVGTSVTEAEAAMLGYFVGDGSCSAGNAVITNADPGVLSHVEECGKLLGFGAYNRKPRAGSASTVRFDGGVRDWLRRHDIYGCTSYTKRAPQAVFRAHPDVVRAFLAAYFDCDGYIPQSGAPEYCSVSRELLMDVKSLLARLGIDSHLRPDKGIAWRLKVPTRAFAALPFHSVRVGRLASWAARAPQLGGRQFTHHMTVEPAGLTACRCLTVADDETFVADGFVVHNSTLFTCDIPCWLIVRDRGIRILVGSHTERMARFYTDRIRRILEATRPLLAETTEKQRGLAFDAEATLAGDYGAFRPEEGLWRVEQFIVVQPNPTDEKEPTVSAYGKDGGVIGNRVDFMIWDDMVTDGNMQKIEARDDIWRWWGNTVEKRIEPGGLCVLQGQRLHADDTYRRCIDKRVPALDEDGEEIDDASTDGLVPMYHHIVYKAHYDDRCTGEHGKTAVAYPGGCLLDPLRLKWRELRRVQYTDPGEYRTVFQQEDGDPAHALVQRAWFNGGRDNDGFEAPGCWDVERVAGAVPEFLRTSANVRAVTVDPSPTKFWAIQDWVYVASVDLQYLIDLHSGRMEAPELWHWDALTQEAKGLLVGWAEKAKEEKLPIRYLIFERNAAQRFFLQDPNFKRWCGQQSIVVRPHDTGLNKSDPKLGVPALGPHYQHGRIRVPGDRATGTRAKMMRLYDEVTRWPEGRTDDQVMAHWFLVHNLARIAPDEARLYRFARPSWVSTVRRTA